MTRTRVVAFVAAAAATLGAPTMVTAASAAQHKARASTRLAAQKRAYVRELRALQRKDSIALPGVGAGLPSLPGVGSGLPTLPGVGGGLPVSGIPVGGNALGDLIHDILTATSPQTLEGVLYQLTAGLL